MLIFIFPDIYFLYAYSVEGPMGLEAILALGERLGTSWILLVPFINEDVEYRC